MFILLYSDWTVIFKNVKTNSKLFMEKLACRRKSKFVILNVYTAKKYRIKSAVSS